MACLDCEKLKIRKLFEFSSHSKYFFIGGEPAPEASRNIRKIVSFYCGITVFGNTLYILFLRLRFGSWRAFVDYDGRGPGAKRGLFGVLSCEQWGSQRANRIAVVLILLQFFQLHAAVWVGVQAMPDFMKIIISSLNFLQLSTKSKNWLCMATIVVVLFWSVLCVPLVVGVRYPTFTARMLRSGVFIRLHVWFAPIGTLLFLPLLNSLLSPVMRDEAFSVVLEAFWGTT